MSIFIYQIGDFVSHLESTNVAGLRVDTPRTFRGEAIQPAGGVAMTFSNPIQLPEPQEISVSGTLICRDCLSVNEQMNRLMSLGGLPFIDIIGYIPYPCCGGVGCAECGNCRKGHPVQWVTTTGMIVEIERATEINDSNVHPTEAIEVSLRLKLDVYWHPINKFLWAVNRGTDEAAPFSEITSPEYDWGRLPTTPTGKFVFRRKPYRNWYTMYTPHVWVYNYYDNDSYNVSALQRAVRSYPVNANRRRWNAPPTAVYAFRNVLGSSNLSLDVKSEISPGRWITHRSSLDLLALNTYLISFGLGTLQNSDIVYATDGVYAPGFIVRNGAPLTLQSRIIKPEWVYSYESPGQLLGINNIVTASGFDLPVEMAWYHQYRLL